MSTTTLSSQFIDDELSLDEKLVFVKDIHHIREFYEETVSLLEQEQWLSADMGLAVPEFVFNEPVQKKKRGWAFLTGSVWTGLAAAAAVLLVVWFNALNPALPQAHANRFVIYKPDVSKVEITGSFTGWERVPLHEIGKTGYWEITLELPRGVHRFTYILDGHTPYADPTVLAFEQDDFGGVDSIINTET